MKKISLKNLNGVEQLSREQLKNVLGGFTGSEGSDTGSSTGSGTGIPTTCWCRTATDQIVGFSPNPNITPNQFLDLVDSNCGDYIRLTCDY